MKLEYRLCRHEKHEGFQRVSFEDFEMFGLSEQNFKIIEEKYIQLELNHIRLVSANQSLQMFARIEIEGRYLFILSHYEYILDIENRNGFKVNSILFYDIILNTSILKKMLKKLCNKTTNYRKSFFSNMDLSENSIAVSKNGLNSYENWLITENPKRCFLKINSISNDFAFGLTSTSIIYFSKNNDIHIDEFAIPVYNEIEEIPLVKKEIKEIKEDHDFSLEDNNSDYQETKVFYNFSGKFLSFLNLFNNNKNREDFSVEDINTSNVDKSNIQDSHRNLTNNQNDSSKWNLVSTNNERLKHECIKIIEQLPDYKIKETLDYLESTTKKEKRSIISVIIKNDLFFKITISLVILLIIICMSYIIVNVIFDTNDYL